MFSFHAIPGTEADKIRRFKEALGLSDEDAAPVHLDVGRRFIRSSYEAGSREANAAEKQVGEVPSAGVQFDGPGSTDGSPGLQRHPDRMQQFHALNVFRIDHLRC